VLGIRREFVSGGDHHLRVKEEIASVQNNLSPASFRVRSFRLWHLECIELSDVLVICRSDALDALGSLRLHWPEYLIEAAGLTLYMFLTCVFASLLQHPASPVRLFIVSPVLRRALMGLAIGGTVAAMILTPWGKQSGGHFNPAITFTFYRLGKVEFWDALFYAAAQFFGAMSGVAIAAFVLSGAPEDRAIQYAVTAPGVYGGVWAFVAELTISFTLMTTILFVSNRATLAQFTPYFVGALYAAYITFETPLSGMSMNPARTFGPAVYASYWHALWIYFTAPALGMLAGAELFLRTRGGCAPYCAKLHHANDKRCIFRHGYRTAKLQNC
jgi:aquaporin Z